MKRNQFKLMCLSVAGLLLATSCTDLEIEETDSIIDRSTATGGIFNGVENVEASIDNVFNGINRLGDQANYYALQEVAGDYELVPTRGTDWGDNGIWRTLHNHTWTPSHQYVLNVWNNWNSSVFLASEIIDSRSNPTTAQEAQARFARAYAMWIIMDNYGQVPFRQPDEGPEIDPVVLSRSEALAFVLEDLDFAIANTPSVSSGDIDNLNRASVAAARFLKARVLLNAHIYRGEATAASADMAEVISLVDAIAGDGFAIEDDYFDIFEQSADSETIWWIPAGVGNRIWNGMHYNIVSPDNGGGGWNGFSVLSEFYDSFEGDANSNRAGSGQEERRGFVPTPMDGNIDESNGGIGFGFLIGQQYNADGDALTTRPGAPLEFTRDFPGLVGNGEATGIRTIKYHPLGDGGSFRGHSIIFRYADAHLMKAEATMRSGGDATALVNELRALRGASPLGSVSEAELLAERGREMYKEMTRRSDLVRFGMFTKDWEFKDGNEVGNTNRNLFPIPSNALLSNPNLVQNPGY